MSIDQPEPIRDESQVPTPAWPAGTGSNIDQSQPSLGSGGAGFSQAPAQTGFSYNPPAHQPPPPYGAPIQPGYSASGDAGRSRRNWTPCYVGACLFLLLALIGAVSLAVWGGQHLGKGIFGNVFSLAMRLDQLNKDVSATPLESIKDSATPATLSEIQANPADFCGEWLVVEGTLTDEPSESKGSFSLGGTSQSIDAMMYPVDSPVVILDISGSPAVAHNGDTIRAYGKAMQWDFSNISELPFIGKTIEEGMKNDPSLKGQTSVYFFIAKEVELAPAQTPDAGSEKQAETGESSNANQDEETKADGDSGDTA